MSISYHAYRDFRIFCLLNMFGTLQGKVIASSINLPSSSTRITVCLRQNPSTKNRPSARIYAAKSGGVYNQYGGINLLFIKMMSFIEILINCQLLIIKP